MIASDNRSSPGALKESVITERAGLGQGQCLYVGDSEYLCSLGPAGLCPGVNATAHPDAKCTWLLDGWRDVFVFVPGIVGPLSFCGLSLLFCGHVGDASLYVLRHAG